MNLLGSRLEMIYFHSREIEFEQNIITLITKVMLTLLGSATRPNSVVKTMHMIFGVHIRRRR